MADLFACLPEDEDEFMARLRTLFFDLINNNQLAELEKIVQRAQSARLHHRQYQVEVHYFAACLINAQNRYQEAAAALRDLLTNHHPALPLRARILTALGISYDLQGRFDQAIQTYEASAFAFQQLGNCNGESKAINNLGIIYHQLGDYAKAKEKFAQAYALARQSNDSEAEGRALLELGYAAKELGELEQAHASYTEALAIFINQASVDLQGKIYNNLGEVHFLQGHPEAAVKCYKQALDHFRSPTLSSTERDQADVQCNLALLYLTQQRLSQAVAHLQQARALDAAVSEKDRLLSCRILYLQIRLDAYQNKSHNTIYQQLTSAIEQCEELSKQQTDLAIRMRLRAMLQHIYDEMILFCIKQKQDWVAAFDWMERARSRVFLDHMALHKTLQGQAAPSLAAVAVQEPLTLAQIRAHLPEQVAIVEYFVTGRAGPAEQMFNNLPEETNDLRTYFLPPETLLAFIVTKADLHLHLLANRIHQHHEQYFYGEGNQRLRGTATPLDGERLSALSRWQPLSEDLIAPLLPDLRQKRHVIFVPHSALHYVPLHALGAVTHQPFPDDLTVSYAPSASVLMQTGLGQIRDRKPALSALVVGVEHDGLIHARAEAEWVAAELQRQAGKATLVTKLLNERATVAQVCAAMPQNAVIHIACHGNFKRATPMNSSLVLHQGEELSAAEIMQLTLDADLVVLSACDTGLNQLEHGDELIGMTRAFLGAGARSLMVTLWPVIDLSTRLFMEAFYAHWFEHHDPPAAMVHAQRTLRTMTSEQLRSHLQCVHGMTAGQVAEAIKQLAIMSPNTDYLFAHPYHWAAFVLVGNPS